MALTLTGAHVARLRRCTNRFFTTNGVLARGFRTSLVANATGYARRSFRASLELIPTERADLSKPTFGRIRFALSRFTRLSSGMPAIVLQRNSTNGVSLVEAYQCTGGKSMSTKTA